MTSKQADIHYIRPHWEAEVWANQSTASLGESIRVLEMAAHEDTRYLAMNYMSIMDSYKRLEALINKMHRAPVGKYEVY